MNLWTFTAAAKTRYEELKKQTQAELKQTLDNFLEKRDETIKAKRWEVNLDISAPQVSHEQYLFKTYLLANENTVPEGDQIVKAKWWELNCDTPHIDRLIKYWLQIRLRYRCKGIINV